MAPQIVDRVQNTSIIDIPEGESCMQKMATTPKRSPKSTPKSTPKPKTDTKYSCANLQTTPSSLPTSKHNPNSKTSTPDSSCQQTPTHPPSTTQKSSRITQALCSNICSYKKMSFLHGGFLKKSNLGGRNVELKG